jgi:hypothetical protein
MGVFFYRRPLNASKHAGGLEILTILLLASSFLGQKHYLTFSNLLAIQQWFRITVKAIPFSSKKKKIIHKQLLQDLSHIGSVKKLDFIY